MKDEILIRYINKHCTATEEKEILEWLKEKDNRQRLFELEQIWGLKAEMRFFFFFFMDEACSLLRISSMKINEIGSSLGYSDAYYFSRIFKKTIGVSPKKYRERFDQIPKDFSS